MQATQYTLPTDQRFRAHLNTVELLRKGKHGSGGKKSPTVGSGDFILASFDPILWLSFEYAHRAVTSEYRAADVLPAHCPYIIYGQGH